MFYAIYIHDTKLEPYTELIMSRAKTIETRNRDSLRQLVGQRVGIIRTRAGHSAELVGAATITGKFFADSEYLDEIRDQTCIPTDSKYNNERGKWCYILRDPAKLEQPIELSALPVVKRNMSYAVLFEEVQ